MEMLMHVCGWPDRHSKEVIQNARDYATLIKAGYSSDQISETHDPRGGAYRDIFRSFEIGFDRDEITLFLVSNGLDDIGHAIPPSVRDLSRIDVTPEQWSALTPEQRLKTRATIENTKAVTMRIEQQNAERAAKGRYTLEQAAELFEKGGGERKKVMLRKLRDAAREGDLPVYEPGRNARYEYGPRKDTEQVREFYEEAYWDDLNKWIDQKEPRCVFRFDDPAVANGSTRLGENASRVFECILGSDFFPPGTYLYKQAAQDIAKAQGWDDERQEGLESEMARAINAWQLLTYDRKTGLRKVAGEPPDFFLAVTVDDVNKWLEGRGASYRWAPVLQAATTRQSPHKKQPGAERGDDANGDDTGRKPDDGLTKRERQIQAIEAIAKELKYPLLAIPDGGKSILRGQCKNRYPDLFGAGDSPFNDAWKEASPNRLRMRNHSKYSARP